MSVVAVRFPHRLDVLGLTARRVLRTTDFRSGLFAQTPTRGVGGNFVQRNRYQPCFRLGTTPVMGGVIRYGLVRAFHQPLRRVHL
jgi:hypothetical protein